jgi:hypothetical protein
MIPAARSPQAGTTELTHGDYTYTLHSGKASITRFSRNYTGALSITNILGEHPVTAIGDAAFQSCRNLTDVTIPGCVTSMGSRAFLSCTSLTQVLIPASLTNIGLSAFGSCPLLKAITVDTLNPLFSSDQGVLFDKNQSRLIRYPCAKAGSYRIPAGVSTIATYAFMGCSSLTSVTIPDSVGETDDYPLFKGCTRLTSITVDKANPDYRSEEGVLFSKDRTRLIQFPGGKSGMYAIPPGVTNIDNYAFGYCSGLTNLIIPAGVTRIGENAFYGCTNLPDSISSRANGRSPGVIRAVATRAPARDAPQPPSITKDDMQSSFREKNLELIRNGSPPVPIALTPEDDAKLVEEGVLPPQTKQANRPPRPVPGNPRPPLPPVVPPPPKVPDI